jgi:hypothetical protein
MKIDSASLFPGKMVRKRIKSTAIEGDSKIW